MQQILTYLLDLVIPEGNYDVLTKKECFVDYYNDFMI